ncbi:MAG: helix-turn-helix transcriptional regulator [Bacteroidaceae bacterium]|jgi:putative transcriptional regulator|nr:helix-turn-helix transcriptional regulator [Bacteroidaceae bacterium]
MKNNLRVERARVRMTQQDLADKTGVTRQTIVAIEQGKFNPSTVLALKMARVFGVTIEALFELEDTD